MQKASKGEMIVTAENKVMSVIEVQKEGDTWLYLCREWPSNGDKIELFVSEIEIKAVDRGDVLTSIAYL